MTRRLSTFAAAAALTLAGGIATVGMAPVASASTPSTAKTHVGKGLTLSPFEARLLKLINGARAQAGLSKLTAEPGSTDVARRWSLHLAHDGVLSHNPALVAGMEHAGSHSWRNLAENVGEGPGGQADRLFAAYMASAPHRANILSRTASYVGIGTVQVSNGDGTSTAWNTMTFVDAYSTHYGKAKTNALGIIPVSDLVSVAGRWRTSL